MDTLLNLLIKLVARKLGDINSATFDKIVHWVVAVGQDPAFESGLEEANEVFRRTNTTFPREKAVWAIRTVVQLAYAVARAKGLPT